MDQELIKAGKDLSPIFVAIIGGLAGLVSGVIASLVAPWVHHKLETKKQSLEYKRSLIKDVRKLLDKSTSIEEIQASSLWGVIDSHLNKEERKKALGNIIRATTIVYEEVPKLKSGEKIEKHSIEEQSIFALRKSGISTMLARLEREWKLI